MKHYRKLTETWAKETISKYKDNTAYFGKNCFSAAGERINTYSEMYDMLRNRFTFGEAEANCIIASIVIAGGEIRK